MQVQVFLCAILSRLYWVLEDYHMSTDTLLQNVSISFLISTIVSLALNLPMKSHLRSG